MKKRVLSFVAAGMMLSAAMPASAAPLFPDVKDDHWAKDAVAKLAAQGLLEGYPDGTFKGDRAATRWEVAMIIARLLAKMEQAHATFATKAELDEVRKLANALKEELDALGVRVTNLEENVSRLDKRVSELERITFYGYVDTRGSMSTFTNEGATNNANGAAAPTAGSVPFANYNDAVGSVNGARFTPQTNGVLPVADYRNGRPLLNGVGFTARAVLGLRIRVSEDIDAGAEFSAFTSQGNQFIDAYWGVTAPWQSNTFTSNTNASSNIFGSTGALNSGGNAPFSRMTLDSFWVVHNPSQTKLILGAFQETNMDNLIYAGQWNPGAYGPRFLGGFGFDVSGKVDVSDTGVFRWEALGTRLGDSNGGFVGYDTFLLGADVEFEFDGGSVKANFARVNQDNNQAGIGARAVGQANGFGNGNFGNGGSITAAPGALNAPATGFGATAGTSPLQWVNPVGQFFNQAPAGQRGGAGSTNDTRPIPGQGGSDAFGGVQGGGFGPQGMVSYGLSANYKWDLSGGDTQIYIAGNYAHSDYRPNQNSGYSVGGNAYRFEVGANLLDGDLDLGIQYLSVDPTYDPFVLQVGGLGQTVAPMNLPNLNYYQGLYSLHDTSVYPHNRRGFRFNGQYRFAERRGLVWAKVGILDQVRTSLYDVRFQPNSVGAGTPNGSVLGFAPGFMDPVFAGYAAPQVYGGTSRNSFDVNLNPLEDQRGKHTNWGIGASYKFDDPRVKIELGYERNEFRRNSNLVAALGGSQNQVNMDIGSLHGQVNWEASDKWTLRAGADYTTISGHYDPAGRYNDFAVATGSTTFNNIDSTQLSPFIGFDFDVSANTQWNMDFRYYTTTSGTNVPTTSPVSPAAPGQVGNTNNPFEWNGWQVSTQFKVKF
jgi:hypothetical protein